MSIERTQAIIADLAEPIATAPRDGTVIQVFLPATQVKKNKHRAMWVRSRWITDEREERSERRHDLMMKHDGYWAKARFDSTEPLHCRPTHWLPELPNLEEMGLQ